MLWHTIVGSIQKTMNNLIRQSGVSSTGVDAFQSCQMIIPRFIVPRYNQRVGELKQNILEEVGEIFTEKSLDVLKDKTTWLQLSYSAYCLGKHITTVGLCTVFASQRERLTRWPSCNHINFLCKITVLYKTYILCDQSPLFCQ